MIRTAIVLVPILIVALAPGAAGETGGSAEDFDSWQGIPIHPAGFGGEPRGRQDYMYWLDMPLRGVQKWYLRQLEPRGWLLVGKESRLSLLEMRQRVLRFERDDDVLWVVATADESEDVTAVVLERPEPFPRSVEEAVQVLMADWLSSSFQDWILRNPKWLVVASLHLPFGTEVRNSFGLWGDNPELLESCGVDHPEACSGIIFDHLWETVREGAEPALRHELDCQFQLAEAIQVAYEGFHRLRLGESLDQLQTQIDAQLASMATSIAPGCTRELRLQATRHPDVECSARVDFAEDGLGPLPLDSFLGKFSWRSGFTVLYSPPELDLVFAEPCACPDPPPREPCPELQLQVGERCCGFMIW